MNYKDTIFVTDMDGTLLNPDKSVSDRNYEAIKKYQSEGGLFGFATGRPIQTTMRYVDLVKPNLPSILYNGCIVFDHASEEIIHATYLSDCARDILIDVYSHFPSIAPEIYTFEGQYYLNMNTTERWHHSILNPGFISSYEDYPPKASPFFFIKKNSCDEIVEPWCKLLFADEVEVIDQICEYVRKFDGMGVRFVRSCEFFLELLPMNVSKGCALKEMISILDIKGRKLVTAGDFDNDIEMLQASDISFCPADSQQAVLKTADHVLKSSYADSAIAEALETLLKL